MTLCSIDDLSLRPASFRGVGFEVNSDTTTTGRRIITHEYPKRDLPYQEDMGRKYVTYKVTGYVHGEDCEAHKDAVLAACTTPGPALLILPQSAPVLVVCASVSAGRNLDKLGWFTLDFEFREALDLIGGLSASLYFPGLIGTLFDTTVSLSSALFQEGHDTSLQTINVVNDAVTRVEDIAATVISWVEGSPIIDTDSAQLALRNATVLLYNAPYFASPDPSKGAGASGVTAVGNNAGTSLARTGTGRAETIPLIAECIDKLFDALGVDDAIHVFGQIKDFTSSAPEIASLIAPSDTVNNINEDRLCGAFRRMAHAKWAEAVVSKTYETRAQAVQARADLVESFYDMTLASDYDEALAENIRDIRDSAVDALSKTILKLTPILTITTTTAMSALYWSYRVQGNLDQAERIAERNEAVDWMNIGGEFTVESRT